MSDENEFTLEKIKNIHSFINNSRFYKIYDVFQKKGTEYEEIDGKASCYKKETLEEIEGSPDVTDLLKDLYSNLYRIYVSLPGCYPDYFDDFGSEDKKICCLSLKYWLYDQIINRKFEEKDINAIFTGWEKYLKGKIYESSHDHCIFNDLKKDEIKKIKNIYALYTVLYDNNVKFETCNNNTCKYLEYVGKGLDEFISSINKCSSKVDKDNYCKEFDEFVKICKDEGVHAGIIVHDESKKSKAKTEGKHLLSV
ncbi:hypothetical protein PVMG_06159 [Plasmodium vivax Mauritania I]|uniref:Uncharacterized protein n=1 Tax=Plasmodium vivax Mauritania I TaxID=1035515 RepID=A0A0J9W3X3_PLAVI|nr:hypothetical protein PVMG_06159 [Plasmodium vivax Mauritania I]